MKTNNNNNNKQLTEQQFLELLIRLSLKNKVNKVTNSNMINRILTMKFNNPYYTEDINTIQLNKK